MATKGCIRQPWNKLLILYHFTNNFKNKMIVPFKSKINFTSKMMVLFKRKDQLKEKDYSCLEE